jgi:hypothetical protein
MTEPDVPLSPEPLPGAAPKPAEPSHPSEPKTFDPLSATSEFLDPAKFSESKKRVSSRKVIERDQIVSRLTSRLAIHGARRQGAGFFKKSLIGLGITFAIAALIVLGLYLFQSPEQLPEWLQRLFGNGPS